MNPLVTMLIAVVSFLYPAKPAAEPVRTVTRIEVPAHPGAPQVPTVAAIEPDGIGGTVETTGPSQMACLVLAPDGLWYGSTLPGDVASANPDMVRECSPVAPAVLG